MTVKHGCHDAKEAVALLTATMNKDTDMVRLIVADTASRGGMFRMVLVLADMVCLVMRRRELDGGPAPADQLRSLGILVATAAED